MPAWVVPGMRLVTHQPASWARLSFPRPSKELDGGGPWTWRVERKGVLQVRASEASPMLGEGPRLGSWDQAVRYFQDRPRGYALVSGVLQKIATEHPPVAVWPLKAEVEGADLLLRWLDLPAGTPLPALHSAWLCPEIPFVFELGLVLRVPVPVAATPALAQPAAGRVVTFRWPSPDLHKPGGRGAAARRRRASC
jgi:hypothetical protein